MENNTHISPTQLLKETITSIENLGGKFKECDGVNIFFYVKRDSKMGQDLQIQRNIHDFIFKEFGLRLMVGFVN